MISGSSILDFSDYISHPKWTLVKDSIKGEKVEKFYPCCSEPYPDITFYVGLTERDAFDDDNDKDIILDLFQE